MKKTSWCLGADGFSKIGEPTRMRNLVLFSNVWLRIRVAFGVLSRLPASTGDHLASLRGFIRAHPFGTGLPLARLNRTGHGCPGEA